MWSRWCVKCAREGIVVLALGSVVGLMGCQTKSPESGGGQSQTATPAPIDTQPPPAPPVAPPAASHAELEVLQRSQGRPEITIESIAENGPIQGHVSGLAASAAGGFKVLVYVHTNQWYIHPYAGQGEGMSWASIQGNLSWTLTSVKRPYVADRVAALLVSTDSVPPATLADVMQVHAVAWVIVRGNGKV